MRTPVWILAVALAGCSASSTDLPGARRDVAETSDLLDGGEVGVQEDAPQPDAIGDTGALDDCQNDVRGLCLPRCLACGPDHVVDEWASDTSADCGMTVPSEDATAVGDCIRQMFREGRPFHGVHVSVGTDSLIGTGWRFAPDGTLWGLRYDSSPCGDLYCQGCLPSLRAFDCLGASVVEPTPDIFGDELFRCRERVEFPIERCDFVVR